MGTPIDFIVTNAGKNAVFNARNKGIKLSLNKAALGSGNYKPAADKSALVDKFTENGVAAGNINPESMVMHFTLIMGYMAEREVSEIGLYTDDGVLFAIAAKESGAFFKLYPNINFVASFGLKLENIADASAIEFSLDGTGGAAVAIMEAHLSAENPHPQYLDFSKEVMREHLAAPDPHPQYALKTFLQEETKRLDVAVNTLLGVTDYLFPKQIECGYSVSAIASAVRLKGAVYSWAESSMVYHLTPEGQHEAWTVSRENEKITANISNRSGTTASAYSGRSNWLVIDTARVMLKKGFIEDTNQFKNHIKSGVFQAGEKSVIYKEAWETLGYKGNEVAVLVTPEGQHESWTVTRFDDRIEIAIGVRSGTVRSFTGYNGRINWTLLKVNATPPVRDIYPVNLTTGVSSGGTFTIPAPSGQDFSNLAFMPIISPENAHEGWTVTRKESGFEVNIFERSGQNRVAYTGSTSWAVFLLEKPVQRKIYRAGVHKITLEAGQQAIVELFGAGAGAGGSIYTPVIENADGEDGADTVLKTAKKTLIAGGGKKGIGGWWGNGSHMDEGRGGLGGVNTISITGSDDFSVSVESTEDGKAGGINRWSPQYRAEGMSALGYSDSNYGGAGGWGIGDESRSGGGSGGAGAYIRFKVKNESNTASAMDLVCGEAGKGWSKSGNPGEDGGAGFAVISFLQ